jgi:hypothetical protein
MEPLLCLAGRQRRRWLLRTDQQLQLGDEIHDQLGVAPQSLPQPRPPAFNAVLGLGEDLLDQALESLRQRRVRDAPLVLVVLAGGEVAPGLHHRPPQLLHQRRLADPGIPRHEDELRPAGGPDQLEAGRQHGSLSLPTVEPGRDEEPVTGVPNAEREGGDDALCHPLLTAVPQIP